MSCRFVCPKCKSESIRTERRLDGNSECLDCHFQGKSSLFYPKYGGFSLCPFCRAVMVSDECHSTVCDLRRAKGEIVLLTTAVIELRDGLRQYDFAHFPDCEINGGDDCDCGISELISKIEFLCQKYDHIKGE